MRNCHHKILHSVRSSFQGGQTSLALSPKCAPTFPAEQNTPDLDQGFHRSQRIGSVCRVRPLPCFNMFKPLLISKQPPGGFLLQRGPGFWLLQSISPSPPPRPLSSSSASAPSPRAHPAPAQVATADGNGTLGRTHGGTSTLRPQAWCLLRG